MKISRSQTLLLLNLGILCAIFILLLIFIRERNSPQQNVASLSDSTHPRISDFALLDQLGKFHKLSRYEGSRGVVLYVHGVGCPIARNHLPALKQLRDQYESKGIAFLLLNCNPQDDRQALQEDAAEREIDIPILKDDAQLVMDLLGIERTCESFLIDPQSKQVVYHGPLDDRLGYESQKTEAKHHYLRDAIDSFLAGKEVVPADTEIRGCAISTMEDLVENSRPPTYVEEVAPILRQRCYTCHRDGGSAPWGMHDYQDVTGWGAMIREVVLARRMPPKQPDTHYLPLAQIHGLLPHEARTIVRWIDAGMPKGEGADPLATAPDQEEDEFDVTKAEIMLPLPPQKLPATGEIAYRTNALKLELNQDAWVRAGRIQPSEPEAMHHAFCRTSPVTGDDSEQRKFSKRGFSDKWRSTNIAAYMPGSSSFAFPPDTGFSIPKKCALVFLYHYNTIGTETTDHPRLGIFLHKKKPLFQLKMETIERRDLRIPPYTKDYQVQDDYVTPEDTLLFGIAPHMHYRGASFQCEVELPNGFKKVIFSMPNYRMTWQGLYWFKNPVAIPKGTTIECSGVFDNSAFNELNPNPAAEVIYGQQSWREMFEGWLIYSERTEENTEKFDRLFQAGSIQNGDDPSHQVEK